MSGIMIMGATGMLGHTLWQTCREQTEAAGTVRAAALEAVMPLLEDVTGVIPGVRAEAPDTVQRALSQMEPDVVVNCIGVVKQIATAPTHMIRLNALFPHELAAICEERGIRLIHLSTDCVFSGKRGRYTERDLPDPIDLYGRSKLAGEPSGPHVLTLRTSMIGWELGGRAQGLLEWFTSQAGGTVSGYTRAIFSGPTTPVLSRAILAAASNPELTGIWHVAAEPIAKFDLLLALRDALGLEIELEPDDRVAIDRSLDATAFSEATGWSAPSWDQMIAELAAQAPARIGEQPAHPAPGEHVARR